MQGAEFIALDGLGWIVDKIMREVYVLGKSSLLKDKAEREEERYDSG